MGKGSWGAIIAGLAAMSGAVRAETVYLEPVAGRGGGALTFTSSLGQTAVMEADEFGAVYVTVSNADGSDALTLSATGPGDEVDAVLTMAAADALQAVLSSGDVTLTLSVSGMPAGAALEATLGGEGETQVRIADPARERAGVSLSATSLEVDASLGFVFEKLPEDAAARVTPGYPGLRDEIGYGGGVTVSANGITADTLLVVALHYYAEDLGALAESELRLHRFSHAAGQYELVGTNNRGAGSATRQAGDFGVDPSMGAVWAVTEDAGSFVVGAPRETLPSMIDPNNAGGPVGSVFGQMCGSVGALMFGAMFVSLAGLRRVRRGAALR